MQRRTLERLINKVNVYLNYFVYFDKLKHCIYNVLQAPFYYQVYQLEQL